jgi:hypothetical protein
MFPTVGEQRIGSIYDDQRPRKIIYIHRITLQKKIVDYSRVVEFWDFCKLKSQPGTQVIRGGDELKVH